MKTAMNMPGIIRSRIEQTLHRESAEAPGTAAPAWWRAAHRLGFTRIATR